MDTARRDNFIGTVRTWLCAGYFLDVRYLALESPEGLQLLGGVIALNPLPPKEDVGFALKTDRVIAGQVQIPAPAAEECMKLFESACAGTLAVDGRSMSFPADSRIDFYSENTDPNRPGVDLHLKVLSDKQPTLASLEVATIDTALRRATPPFDGLSDLCGWLGLDNPAYYGKNASIDIRINPPVDFGDHSALQNDVLTVSLRALEHFSGDQVEFSVRIAPGVGLARHLLGKTIAWAPAEDGLKEGTVQLTAARADVAQCMLTIGNTTVRKHVLVDKARAKTVRLAAAKSLDPGLDQLRAAILGGSDSKRFEKAIDTLVFLYGFSPAPPVDSDAPDLLVTSPGGRLAVVECTLKTSDFLTKVSKLAARRNKLVADLRSIGHAADVHAILVCASPRNEIIAADDVELAKHSVTLLTKENLTRAFEEIQNPPDPDALLERAKAVIAETQRRAQPI